MASTWQSPHEPDGGGAMSSLVAYSQAGGLGGGSCGGDGWLSAALILSPGRHTTVGTVGVWLMTYAMYHFGTCREDLGRTGPVLVGSRTTSQSRPLAGMIGEEGCIFLACAALRVNLLLVLIR